MLWSWKEWLQTICTLGRCNDLEGTDFQQCLPWEDLLVLTGFYNFYFGRIIWSCIDWYWITGWLVLGRAMTWQPNISHHCTIFLLQLTSVNMKINKQKKVLSQGGTLPLFQFLTILCMSLFQLQLNSWKNVHRFTWYHCNKTIGEA